jgi:hypothetical protein
MKGVMDADASVEWAIDFFGVLPAASPPLSVHRIEADLLHLADVRRIGSMASIGGAGTFDGIVRCPHAPVQLIADESE